MAQNIRIFRRAATVGGSFYFKKYSTIAENFVKRPATGLIVGVYSRNDGRHDTSYLTKSAKLYNERTCNQLYDWLRKAGPCPKLGESRLFFSLDPEYTAVAVVGLGPHDAGFCKRENIDRKKENIREAAGVGARAMEPLHLNKLCIEAFGNAESAAEGAVLSLWQYQQMRNPHQVTPTPVLELFEDSDWTGWGLGLEKASAQNLARRLAASPANIMNPVAFSQHAVDVLCHTRINVYAHTQEWAAIKGLGAFLAVARGSCQSPIFLELTYNGAGNTEDKPFLLIGSGCTFDSGGVSKKVTMRGNVSGAACVVASMRAAAALDLPINIRGIIPLAEHMPGANAMKPGDIITAHNGKNIHLQDTRCGNMLLLADALSYGRNYHPKCIIDVGTLTSGMVEGLGSAATGVFTNSNVLWESLFDSCAHTGDRVWRMPLFHHFTKKLAVSSAVDLLSMGRYGTEWSGEPCRAAAFLREFVDCREWLHLDIMGVMVSDGVSDGAYLRAGMTGRPTRSLIELLFKLSRQPRF